MFDNLNTANFLPFLKILSLAKGIEAMASSDKINTHHIMIYPFPSYCNNMARSSEKKISIEPKKIQFKKITVTAKSK